jgi:hypothetical protein
MPASGCPPPMLIARRCLIGQPHPSRRSFVVVEESAEPRPTANRLPRRLVRAVINERVVQPLMILPSEDLILCGGAD